MNNNITQKVRQLIKHRPFVEFNSREEPNLNAFDAIRPKPILATIESIATGTPEHIIPQSDAAKVVANLPNLEKNRSRIEKIYSNTQIETRQLAVDLLSDEAIAFSRTPNNLQARMQMYQEHAVPLAERVARQALQSAASNLETNDPFCKTIEESIRLIVFVSSTGFVAPGVDAALINKLGLRRDTARVTVNFMGCAAAMNGLRVAADHVRSNPTHKALVVCLELSSVNAVFEDDLNDVIIHSIFGDGCAAVVIGACEEEEAIAQGKVVIRDHLSYLVENTEDGITLGVEANGITCRLSRDLPDYIENGVGPVIENFLASHELSKDEIDFWAVHPGGTRIIQKAQKSLGLSDRQVAESWDVLRQYGNMLSASVLFVMQRMLNNVSALHQDGNLGYSNRNSANKPLTGIAFSFSPGVGVEGLLFQKM
ncbi:MAG TPA: 3-oxoacyl-[acyl-carrier-protein] synthase III C-terminal domain-containing protein [Crinalium sp.]|jgi:alpha-pyrone synthase